MQTTTTLKRRLWVGGGWIKSVTGVLLVFALAACGDSNFGLDGVDAGAGIVDADPGVDPVDPVDPQPGPGGDEFIDANTLDTDTVLGQVVVPSGEVINFAALNGDAPAAVDSRLALLALVPAAHAQEGSGAFVSVEPSRLALLRYSTSQKKYEEITEANTDDNAAAFALSSDGFTIDLQALVNAGVLTEAALDTELLLEATLELTGGGEVKLRSPLVESDGLEVSPMTEFLTRILEDAGEAGFADVSISEMRDLLSKARSATVTEAAEKTIDELIEELNETVSGQVTEQFVTAQEPQPEVSAVTAANQNLNVMVLGTSFIGSYGDVMFPFGEYFHWLESFSANVALDDNGRGSFTIRGDAPFRESEVVQSNDGSVAVNFFTDEEVLAESGDEEVFVARLSGSGTLQFDLPAFAEFDNDFFQWEVANVQTLNLPRLHLEGGEVGQFGAVRSRYEYFEDQDGLVDEGDQTEPNFSKPRFRETDAAIVVALPEATLTLTDFNRDLGLVLLDVSLDGEGNATLGVANERFNAAAGNGEFEGGASAFFEINRNLSSGFIATNSDSEVHTDTLSVGIAGSQGALTLTGADGLVGHGIAAPGGSMIAFGLPSVVCENTTTFDVREANATVACDEGEDPIAATLSLALAVPLGAITLADLDGDEYRYQVKEFLVDTATGSRGYEVKSCRGRFTVDAGVEELQFAAGERCINMVRNGANEAALPVVESQIFEDAENIPVELTDGELKIPGEPNVGGYVSADGNTILLRYGEEDATDEEAFVGFIIATRIPTAE